MGVASRKKTIRGRENRRVFYSNPQPRNGLCETPVEEERGTDQIVTPSRLGARAEPQGFFCMLDRALRLPGPQPEKAAHVPAARIVRIEAESAIDQRDHRVDVLAENDSRRDAGQNRR